MFEKMFFANFRPRFDFLLLVSVCLFSYLGYGSYVTLPIFFRCFLVLAMSALLLGVPLQRFSLFIFVFLLSLSALRAQVDSLIDVDTLEKLNAIPYCLNGDGVASTGNEAAYMAAFGTPSCPIGYTGYELTADLDFKNDFTDPANYSIWAEGSTATGRVAQGLGVYWCHHFQECF